jgi:hypothetical protein
MGYELIWRGEGVVKRFFAHAAYDDLVRATLEVESDYRFDHIRWVLNDFLAVAGASVEADHIEEMAAIDKAASLSNSQIIIAIVAADPTIIAMARYYAYSALNAYETRIFSTLAEAYDWLLKSL